MLLSYIKNAREPWVVALLCAADCSRLSKKVAFFEVLLDIQAPYFYIFENAICLGKTCRTFKSFDKKSIRPNAYWRIYRSHIHMYSVWYIILNIKKPMQTKRNIASAYKHNFIVSIPPHLGHNTMHINVCKCLYAISIQQQQLNTLYYSYIC